MEFVACTGKAPQPHTLETVVRLEVRKTHLDLLSLVAGFGELECTHQGARCIPCVFMHVARDLSKGHIGSAIGLASGARVPTSQSRLEPCHDNGWHRLR